MRILQVFRTPIGGLFRHVCDLVRGQVTLGHEVGIFCDSSTGGVAADAALAKIAPLCKLGVHRLPMTVLPSVGDLRCISKVRKLTTDLNVDIVHGHGAKGGLYARLAPKRSGIGAVYTPHGGSLHYDWLTLPGFLYMATEWVLRHHTSGLAFVCEFEHKIFDKKIGVGQSGVNVVHNGLWADEFMVVPPPSNASDILFVGEMCDRKGVDVLLRALAELKPTRKLSAALVGDGEDIEEYKTLSQSLGLDDQVKFHGRLNFPTALSLGKVFVLPSRLESFPYVILEAIAAGRPIVSTKVGGLAEVLPEALLCQPDDVKGLAAKLIETFDNLAKYQAVAVQLSIDGPKNFGAETMVKRITDFYAKLK